jgi:hypothetical protein
MSQIEIRQGTAEDARLITDLIKKMVIEMANYGGHFVNRSPAIWASMEADAKANSVSQEYIYLIAIHRLPVPTVVGIAVPTSSRWKIFLLRKRDYISAPVAPNRLLSNQPLR